MNEGGGEAAVFFGDVVLIFWRQCMVARCAGTLEGQVSFWQVHNTTQSAIWSRNTYQKKQSVSAAATSHSA